MSSACQLSTAHREALRAVWSGARLDGIVLRPERGELACLLDVPTLSGHDTRRWFICTGVARLAASFRLGRFHDPDAWVVPLDVSDLTATLRVLNTSATVQSIQLDAPAPGPFERWRGRASCDLILLSGDDVHTLDIAIIGEVPDRTMELRVGFAGVRVETVLGMPMPLDDVLDDADAGMHDDEQRRSG